MSAPAAVAFAKLNYPEIEETKYKTDKDLQLDRGYALGLGNVNIKRAQVKVMVRCALNVCRLGYESLLLSFVANHATSSATKASAD